MPPQQYSQNFLDVSLGMAEIATSHPEAEVSLVGFFLVDQAFGLGLPLNDFRFSRRFGGFNGSESFFDFADDLRFFDVAGHANNGVPSDIVVPHVIHYLLVAHRINTLFGAGDVPAGRLVAV